MRLAFHDCVLNKDGTGGCDGCTDWSNMHHEGPNANGPKEDHYKFDPVYETDNNGMDQITAKLELIYSTIDWPFVNSSLEVSLQQSGKSRADLWQLAGLVALERTMERANRACDLDYHARQQVTLLENREKCEIKLTKPLKFQTGRIDCISNDTEGRHYISPKPEVGQKYSKILYHSLNRGIVCCWEMPNMLLILPKKLLVWTLRDLLPYKQFME